MPLPLDAHRLAAWRAEPARITQGTLADHLEIAREAHARMGKQIALIASLTSALTEAMTLALQQREELVAERALRLLLEDQVRDLRAQLEAARAVDRTQGAANSGMM